MILKVIPHILIKKLISYQALQEWIFLRIDRSLETFQQKMNIFCKKNLKKENQELFCKLSL